MTIRERSLADPTFTTVDTMDQLTMTIQTAARNGATVRVRGAMHSVRDAIVTSAPSGANLILGTDFQTVGAVDSGAFVRVGGGRRLGGDPDENVKPTDGLLGWLASQKPPLSVPDLGGITHQSVGGFLSTGSSGGSLKYSLEDAIQAIEFVDGTGQQRVVERDMEGDFAAFGVSMGLFGVITGVVLLPNARFAIVGTESTTDIDKAAFQPFAPGAGGLQAYLTKQDYCRIMWWPQHGVEKLVTWQASRTPLTPSFIPNPYRELGDPDENPVKYPTELWSMLVPKLVLALIENGSALVALLKQYRHTLPRDMTEFVERTIAAIQTEDPEGLLKILQTAMDSEIQQFGVDLYFSLLGNRRTNALARDMFKAIFDDETTWEAKWSPLVMNGIFLTDDGAKVKPGPQQFQDYGDTGLPMDNQISDLLMPTEFTELWIPIDRTVDVMTALRDHYVTGGYAATGTYACELYGTKSSEFWMSPAYDQDVIRVDLFWFGRNGDSTPQQFYQPFWDLLRAAKLPFRPHWGKYLPPHDTYGKAYYKSVYPRMDDFLALRQKYDPRQVFVSDYWRDQFSIPTP